MIELNQLLQMAREGNAKAIATLLTRSLQDEGIRALAKVEGEYLHVILEGQEIAPDRAFGWYVGERVEGFGTTAVSAIRVYGRQAGSNSIDWQTEVVPGQRVNVFESDAIASPEHNTLAASGGDSVATSQQTAHTDPLSNGHSPISEDANTLLVADAASFTADAGTEDADTSDTEEAGLFDSEEFPKRDNSDLFRATPYPRPSLEETTEEESGEEPAEVPDIEMESGADANFTTDIPPQTFNGPDSSDSSESEVASPEAVESVQETDAVDRTLLIERLQLFQQEDETASETASETTSDNSREFTTEPEATDNDWDDNRSDLANDEIDTPSPATADTTTTDTTTAEGFWNDPAIAEVAQAMLEEEKMLGENGDILLDEENNISLEEQLSNFSEEELAELAESQQPRNFPKIALVIAAIACGSIALLGGLYITGNWNKGDEDVPTANEAPASPPAAPKPTATASPATSSIPAASPSPAAPNNQDSFQQAVDRAMEAATLTQSAKTQADWQTVIGHWQAAISAMKSVSANHPRHAVAQQKAAEYSKNLAYAKRAATNASP